MSVGGHAGQGRLDRGFMPPHGPGKDGVGGCLEWSYVTARPSGGFKECLKFYSILDFPTVVELFGQGLATDWYH